MRSRSSFNLPVESPPNPSTSNPKRRNCRRSKQPFILEESLVDTMTDQRNMAKLLRAPTEGYAKAIVVPLILAEQLELKHSLINMMTSDQFFGLEKDISPDYIRWFNKITSTIKYKDVPNSAIKLVLFPFSLAGAACWWLEKEPMRSILTWEDLVSKFINEFFPPSRTTNLHTKILNFQQGFDESFHEAWDRYKDLLRACPHHGFTKLHQLDTFYNALNQTDQDSLNSAAGGNLLERRTQYVLTIIKNKSKVRNSRNKSVVSQVKSSDANSNSSSEVAKLTHAVNQQTSVVTTAMTTILKHLQATPPPISVKAVQDVCVTCGAAAFNYNQGNFDYRPSGMANPIRPSGFPQPNVQNNQNRFSQPQGYNQGNNFNQDQPYQAPTQQNQVVPLSELEKVKRMNEAIMKAMQTQLNNVKNKLRNEMKNSIQASMSNQTNELKNMMASFFQMNNASTSGSGSLPSNTIANLKGELKAITTRSEVNEKLGDPGKFLIPYGFSELKCKDLADLGASINLMPLFVWKKLGLPELISTRMTLELANRAICTPAGIARDVFVPGRPFLRTTRALIDVHGEEMILHDGDERLTLNMRHDTSSYSSQPQKESINMINVFNDSSGDFLEKLFTTNHQSGNPTFSSHPKLTSPEVKDDVFDPDQVLKPFFPSPILVEDSESFLEKSDTSLSYSDISLPEFKIFYHTEETNSSSNHTHADYSLSKYDSFLFEIEPDQGKLTSIVMKDHLAKPRVHMPNVLTTHPTLMLDSDFIPSDNSLPEFETFYFDIEENNNGSTTIHADISLSDLECFNFDFKPDLGELTSIVDFGICENVPSATNVNLPPKEDHYPLFAYVVWIFLSFLTYLVVPLNLLSFRNEDTIFDPGISNYHFPSLFLDVSHRCETFMKFNVYPKLLNESPMEILSSSCSPMEQ
nr:reverse transcriptase domain-containing protein [Tanacetum cinerariifolium]